MNDWPKHAAWFGLAVRLIGLWALVEGIAMVVQFATLMLNLSTTRWGGDSIWRHFFSSIPGPLARAGIGVFLFWFSAGFVKRCMRDAMSRCPACHYSLVGSNSPNCPECGSVVRRLDESAAEPSAN
jgi:hypothetical protein